MAYDAVVIGGGPAGYVFAIRAAQLGMKVACVEMADALGGTCLRVGCIPSKALLESSRLYREVGHGLETHGIEIKDYRLDLAAMLKRKDKVVTALTKGVQSLFKKNGIEWIKGRGRVLGAGRVEVRRTEGVEVLEARHIVLATGSESASLRGIDADGVQIVTSTEALSFSEVPKTLTVIGAGAIGLELGSVWSRLGAEVTVIEYLDRILPFTDAEIALQVQKALEKQGMKFLLSTAVQSAKAGKSGGVRLAAESKGQASEIKADKVLVAVGRRPFTDGLGLAETGVKLDVRGFVEIDSHFQTSLSGVYAIGDVVRGPMLAHKGEDEGVALAERLAGQAGHVNYDVIPNVVYTWPEVASVGRTEAQCKEAAIAVKIGKFPFMASGRAKAMEEKDGMVKLIADARTDRVLGAHLFGPNASELVAEIALGMEFGASAEDIARTCHAHPTLSEAVKEAALDVGGRAIHK